MNNSFYFQHDYATREDEKIIDLMSEWGWAGYGLYWGLVEMLANNGGYLEFNCKRIAFALGTDKDCIADIIKGYDLFGFDGYCFYSQRLLDQLSYRESIRQKRRDAALQGWHGKESDANASQKQNNSNANKSISNGKERKGKERKNEGTSSPSLSLEERKNKFYQDVYAAGQELNLDEGVIIDFYEYWSEHNPQGNKMKFEKQPTFSIKSRFRTWIKNEEKFGHNSKPQLTEDFYLNLSIQEKKKYDHPLKLRGNKGEVKQVDKPGRPPKKIQ